VNYYSNESHDSHMALTTDHTNSAPPANSDTAHVSIISPDWDFKEMGIGGLDKVCRLIFDYSIAEYLIIFLFSAQEFSDIFRRAFASRVFPPDVIEQLGTCVAPFWEGK